MTVMDKYKSETISDLKADLSCLTPSVRATSPLLHPLDTFWPLSKALRSRASILRAPMLSVPRARTPRMSVPISRASRSLTISCREGRRLERLGVANTRRAVVRQDILL